MVQVSLLLYLPPTESNCLPTSTIDGRFAQSDLHVVFRRKCAAPARKKLS